MGKTDTMLKTLGFDEIAGFDLRDDRRDQARKRYHVETAERIADVPFDKIGAVIIMPTEVKTRTTNVLKRSITNRSYSRLLVIAVVSRIKSTCEQVL